MERPSTDLTGYPVMVLTTTGWMSGNLHISRGQDVCACLGQVGLLKLTDVLLEESGSVAKFYAVRTRAVALILPNGRFMFQLPASDDKRLTTHLRLSAGNLCGKLDLPVGLRLTDLLEDADRWFPMRNCRVQSGFEPDPLPDGADRWPLVLVNSAAIIGFSDDAVL